MMPGRSLSTGDPTDSLAPRPASEAPRAPSAARSMPPCKDFSTSATRRTRPAGQPPTSLTRHSRWSRWTRSPASSRSLHRQAPQTASSPRQPIRITSRSSRGATSRFGLSSPAIRRTTPRCRSSTRLAPWPRGLPCRSVSSMSSSWLIPGSDRSAPATHPTPRLSSTLAPPLTRLCGLTWTP